MNIVMPRYNDVELNQWKNTNAPFVLTEKEQLPIALEGINHKYEKEARAMFITLWASGARPIEVLDLKYEDVKRTSQSAISITFSGRKGSAQRTLDFPLSNKYASEVWTYVRKQWDGRYLFPHFRSEVKKTSTTKVFSKLNKETGLKETKRVIYNKQYDSTAHNIGYWFKKWGLRTPYYYRHNRMTIAAEDLPIRQLQELKGAKKEESVYCYLRSTKKSREKIGRTLFK